MKRLTDCPTSPLQLRNKPPHTAQLVERKGGKRKSRRSRDNLAKIERHATGQVLSLHSDSPIVVYSFSDDGTDHVDFDGLRPDGVAIGEVDDTIAVVFVELKSIGKDGKLEHGVAQVNAGVHHFAPVGRTSGQRQHGDDHHDAWSIGDDIPLVKPGKHHLVAGVAVVFRAMPRERVWRQDRIAGKTVTISAVHVPMIGFNEAVINFADLLTKASVINF